MTNIDKIPQIYENLNFLILKSTYFGELTKFTKISFHKISSLIVRTIILKMFVWAFSFIEIKSDEFHFY